MNSLYQRLSAWLLAGLGLTWLAVGVVVFATVRRSLEGRFDAELKAMASEVRFFLPEGRHLQAPKCAMRQQAQGLAAPRCDLPPTPHARHGPTTGARQTPRAMPSHPRLGVNGPPPGAAAPLA